jgi:phage tail sheath protein FI
MAKVYSTPGVYIEEKSAFPNSVVAVATAVPAFVGYTEKAFFNKEDATHKPVRISSFGEFLLYFGGAPQTTYDISPSSGGAGFQLEKPAGESHYLLFNSIKLFYANGGADCYIVSVGNYQDTIALDDFHGSTGGEKPKAKGINTLEKYVEPTMLVIPDAVRLTPEQCFSLQKEMLKHCGNTMKDRFAILDIPNGDQPRTNDSDSDVITRFREGVGANFLDFGAAYYPWVDTTITSTNSVSFENIHPDQLQNLMDILKADTQKSVNAKLLQQERAAKINLAVDEIARFDPFLRLERVQTLLQGISQSDISQVNTVSNAASLVPAQEAFDRLEEALDGLDDVIDEIGDKFSSSVSSPPVASPPISPPSSESSEEEQKLAESWDAFSDAWGAFQTKLAATDKTGVATDFNSVLSTLNVTLESKPSTKTQHQTLLAVHPLYKSIVDSIAEKLNLLPPSAAMAGVYTMVDNNIGVFQSPANVSLGSVVKPKVNISGNEQDDLNVPLSGKAVNAIRSFPGKGPLVWGARTLDGNSLDWRYISVRRTVIMIEQSVKNAAEAYVFEPNVSGTWANMKAMLTNFLTNMWANGALAGATPEDAFSVDVGLGVTMTPVDILEGIMRISIKLAVTRPAEFIIITFEQQMQKS